MNPSPRSTLSVLCGLALILPVSLAQEAAADSQLRKAVTEIPHRVLFESKLDGDYDLYVMNADGTGRKNLTNTDGVDEVNGKASPDGRHIVYVRDSSEDGTRVRDVYLMAVDGSDQRKIADDARDPCWSPDSKRVAFLPAEYRRFTTSTWATRGLRIYDLESGKTTDHPNEEIEHLYSLAWTPDGKWFVATVMGGMGFRQGILAVEADGQGVFDLGLSGCRPDITSEGAASRGVTATTPSEWRAWISAASGRERLGGSAPSTPDGVGVSSASRPITRTGLRRASTCCSAADRRCGPGACGAPCRRTPGRTPLAGTSPSLPRRRGSGWS